MITTNDKFAIISFDGITIEIPIDKYNRLVLQLSDIQKENLIDVKNASKSKLELLTIHRNKLRMIREALIKYKSDRDLNNLCYAILDHNQ